ncbi:MAG TPA: imidazole glycerol phosphate synthase subunit HisH [Deltaproteobacteria bacterium]|jgi:glutamine amidotransferase|nr:imidazole glycerol phosphate synthase subunit HisH [Deltaproteobacteria bacterium]HIF69910.1 imidazole glycerol phosphate synthase subunit HisH [Candidatus Lambdaproteobacteria bacterium]HIL16015.1 imidazole glycerol phosphate synthase subunit HisH [Deltaproteobacteria bacterium]|tara:strand:+ start:2658 stop:3269 length:612 start_codon:yes stop_codon:yes gene_type:complete
MATTAIIDYGVGNLANLKNALDHLGVECVVVRDPEPLQTAERILLPGVGAFAPALERLRGSGMLDVLSERMQAGTPLLGICVGSQLLLDESEEDGLHPGLGWIPGRVQRFRHDLKIPQIGWNQVESRKADPLLDGIADGAHFYFVHSYHMIPHEPETTLAETEYGIRFTSVVRKQNVWGVQFHPEKSQDAGLRLLRNFCAFIS